MFPAWFPPVEPPNVAEKRLNIGARYIGPCAVTIDGDLYAGLLFKTTDGGCYMLYAEPGDGDYSASVRFIDLERLPLEPMILPSIEISPRAAADDAPVIAE